MELWTNLKEKGFPEYSVSNFGEVRNDLTNRIIKPSPNQSGLYKIGLMSYLDNIQHTMSVALLVADAYLQRIANPRFNTPINVDGNRSNNRVDNLMWRPRWFAIAYHKQFYNDRRGFLVPVVEIRTGEQFETSWDAAVKYGLIDRDISVATMNNTYVFPTGQQFMTMD